MKKFVTVALSVCMTAATAFSCVSCGKNPAGGTNIDETKTQLYIRNYQGGFGNEWLYNGIDKFQDLYKDVELESGKKGLQIILTEKKETPDPTNIKNDIYEVYFVEKLNYLDLVKGGYIADMTEVVTGDNKYETGKTIVGKMSQDDQAFYGVKDTQQNVHYYALPHYFASQGIVYDVDLFNAKNYYFIDGYEKETDLANKFVQFEEDVKSAGPDGVKGTADDGLPATYEDFWTLCRYISASGDMPFNWGTKSEDFYITALMIQLMADYQGKEEYMRNFTMDGVISEAVLIANGDVVISNGAPVLESLTLDSSSSNGYEQYRSAALYYALDFINTLMDNRTTFGNKDNLESQSYSAFDAQDDYLLSRHKLASGERRYAMLIDGTWWNNEASQTFEDYALVYGDAAKNENCNYGWLPLPKATSAKVEQKIKSTMVNTIDSLCFVKAGLSDWKEDLAFDFVRFMHTDEAFNDFTATTNAFKAFNYEVKDEVVEGLSPFGKDVYAQWSTYDLITPHNNNEQYVSTTYKISSTRRFSISADSTEVFATKVFSNQKELTTGQYLVKAYNYAKSVVWGK